MRFTPFPDTNRAWRLPSSMRWDTRRMGSMPNMMKGQDGKSNSQGEGYLAWLGTTKPVKHAKPNQWRNEQNVAALEKA